MDREFWLGNDLLSTMTQAGDFTLRIDLKAFDGNTSYAEYNAFRVLSENENYKLKIGMLLVTE